MFKGRVYKMNKYEEKINKFVASLEVFYLKLHALHWNVTGKNFKAIHEYVESLYDDATETLDSAAEQLKIQGLYPVASYAESAKLSIISEWTEKRDLTQKEVVESLISDYQALSTLAKEIRDEAVAADDFFYSNFYEDVIADYAKVLWFLKAMDR